MTVLALDLGTTTGWAYGSDTRLLRHGSWTLKTSRFDSWSMRFVRFEKLLAEMYATVRFSQIVYEEVRRHAGTDAAHTYGAFMATLLRWCEERGVPCEGVPVGTIKKHWTKMGNASKAEMMADAKRRGFDVSDDNETDALALAHWFLSVNSVGNVEDLLS